MWRIITLLSLGFGLAYSADSQVLATYAERRPELVSLLVLNAFALPTHTCSGFVLDEHTIVTAARCIFEDDGETLFPLANFRFRAGSPFLNSGGIVYTVDSSIRYTAFLPSNMQRDIAFLGTSFIILFNNNVIPAVVVGYDVAENNPVDTVGWGYLTHPQLNVAELELQHEMPQVVVNWESCRAVYADYSFTLLEDTFCTELVNQSSITDPETRRHKCFGEAGSPVYFERFVVGVRSFDVNCTAALPTVNTRTNRHIFYKNNLPMTINHA